MTPMQMAERIDALGKSLTDLVTKHNALVEEHENLKKRMRRAEAALTGMGRQLPSIHEM